MRTTSIATMLLVAVACGNEDGKTDEYQGVYCAETTTSVSLDEVTALGVSAQDVLDQALGTFDETLTWADDGDVALTLVVSSEADEASYVTGEPEYPDTGDIPAIWVVCPPRLEVAIDVEASTADGALDEAFEATLVVEDTGDVDPGFTESFETLDGSFDPASWVDEDPEDVESVGTSLEARFPGTGSAGALTVQAQGGDADCVGDECVAWAMSLEAGTWDSTGDAE